MSDNIRSVHDLRGQNKTETPKNIRFSPNAVLRARNLSRSFRLGDGSEFHALRDVSLTVTEGAFVALVGSSGSGKSTLLNLIAGLDRPTSGELSVANLDLTGRSEDELARHRGRNVGVVFQFFQLLPTLTVVENVMLAMELVGYVPRPERRERALDLLSTFGIANQAEKLPTTLSGGQQQRVAIARALANDPPLLVADEPTGNLDSRTADHVLTLLSELPKTGKTVIMATHEKRFLSGFDRVVSLADGRVLADEQSHLEPNLPAGAASC